MTTRGRKNDADAVEPPSFLSPVYSARRFFSAAKKLGQIRILRTEEGQFRTRRAERRPRRARFEVAPRRAGIVKTRAESAYPRI